MAFITIEGIEGAGKSTLRAKVAERLQLLPREVVLTREPGATPLGQLLREILLDAKQNNLDPIAELMLFFADRAQHLREVVRPALARGAIVLCDRYIHSTLAYQGYGRQIPLAPLSDLISFATGGLHPDLVLLLDLDPQAGLGRARKRADNHSADQSAAAAESWNRFEQQELNFHIAVRQGFLTLAADPANRFLVLDATESPDALAEKAFNAIMSISEQKF